VRQADEFGGAGAERASRARGEIAWIRAGQEDEWGFAVDQGSVNAFELSAAARELSADTDAATFQWTMTIDNFEYLVDGVRAPPIPPENRYRAGPVPPSDPAGWPEAGRC
jgi:hypothetical protein